MRNKDEILANLIKDLKRTSYMCEDVKLVSTDTYTLNKVREISSISLLAIDDAEMLKP